MQVNLNHRDIVLRMCKISTM